VYELGRRRFHERDAGQHHPKEHRYVDTEYCVRDQRRVLVPHPRRYNHWLFRIFGQVTALHCLMLYAPLAQTLAEGEPRKRAAALNAICHRL
jgi:hypothetical protein